MDEVGACMTQCIVYDETTKESETFCSLTAAKKWMRERIKQKHEVSGQKYRVYSDGEFVNCGSISLTGSNKSLSPIQGRRRKDINNKVTASLTNLPHIY